MRRVVNKIKQDELVRSGGIFLVGSLLVAILNYLYHLFMGRMLGPEEYGVLGSLFAIVYLVTFAGATFNKVISKFTAELNGIGQKAALKYLIINGLLKISIFSSILFIIYLLFIPLIAKFMHLTDYIGLVIVGLIAFLSILMSVIIGALNGMEKFVWQNGLNLITTALKFSIALLLVYLGFGADGALVAIAIGILAVIGISFWPLKNELTTKISKKIQTRNVYLYAIPVLIASVLPIVAITLDQVLVKHFFTSIDAGFYAAAGNIAKIIWFGSGFLVSAIFPKIVSRKAKGKDTSRLLIKSLIYTSFLAFIGVGILSATPRLIVLLMYGKEYLEIVPIVGLFGVALGVFSINQILIAYNLAMQKYGFLWYILIGLILQIVGMILFHSVLSDIIKILLLSQILIMGSMLIHNKKEFSKNGH
jgi:O-antigen/teichoic acid export membrane protein